MKLFRLDIAAPVLALAAALATPAAAQITVTKTQANPTPNNGFLVTNVNGITAQASADLTLTGGTGNKNVVLVPTGTGIVTTAASVAAAGIILPTVNFPNAKAGIRTYDGGAPDDVTVLHYNMSNTLYVPADAAQPIIWQGFEWRFDNPGPTSELYWRVGPIGTVSPLNLIQPLFFNVNASTNAIISGQFRAEIVSIANTDGTSRYFSADSTSASILPDVSSPIASVGPSTTGVNFAVNAANPLVQINAVTITNPARMKFTNSGGNVTIGTNGSTATGIFSGTGDSVYSFGINNLSTTPINLGHTNVEMTILNGGTVGIGTTAPLSKFTVTGASSTSASGTGIVEVTTGTGGAGDNKVQLGVHNSDYTFVQAIQPGVAYRNLALQPEGGSLGVGTNAPAVLLHVKGPASPSIRLEQTGGTNVWDLITDGIDLYQTDATNGRSPIVLKNSGDVLLTPSGTGNVTVSGPLLTVSNTTRTGGLIATSSTFSTGHTMLITEVTAVYTGTGGHTFTFLAASTNAGRVWFVKNAGSGAVTVDATGLGQFFTTTLVNTISLSVGDSIMFQSDGSHWNTQ